MSDRGPARKVSVVLIAQNEGARVGDAIRACKSFADEFILLDGGSKDDTVAVAKSLGCTILVNPWPGYAAQRNFGAEKAAHDWIFALDADEVADEDLASGINRWKTSPLTAEAYSVRRVNDFLGKWMESEEIVRLYDRTRTRVKDVSLNETVEVPPEKVEVLPGFLWHFGFRSVGEHLHRFARYTEIDAATAKDSGERFRLLRLLIRPPARFIQRYFVKGLCLKGVPGLSASLFWTYYEVMRELRLYEAWWRSSGGNHQPRRAARG